MWYVCRTTWRHGPQHSAASGSHVVTTPRSSRSLLGLTSTSETLESMEVRCRLTLNVSRLRLLCLHTWCQDHFSLSWSYCTSQHYSRREHGVRQSSRVPGCTRLQSSHCDPHGSSHEYLSQCIISCMHFCWFVDLMVDFFYFFKRAINTLWNARSS